MPDPVFSVVIPSYNRANFLNRALGSVLSQTFQDYEVIVADDGSTDETPKLLDEWRERFGGRLRILWLAHGGASAARNAGISASRGRAVAFLDSDDEWLPQHLSTCCTALQVSPEAGLIFTDHIIQSDERIRTRAPNVASRHEMVRNIILRRAVVLTTAVVVSRRVLEKAGAFKNELCGTEDWELWARIAIDHSVVQVPEATVIIHQHLDNHSRDPFALDAQFHAAAQEICRLRISPYCGADEVIARAFFDTAEFYAIKAERGRAWRNLAMALWNDASIVRSRGCLRVVARATLPPAIYHWLRARSRRGSLNGGS